MKAAVSCALALLAVTALSAASSTPAARYVHASCGTTANVPTDGAHPKVSSFAPHPGAHSRVYGVPIQPRIFKSRPKKKPQLTSSPLPDS
ncbi:MAG TPA: hypothetical protein VGY90_02220 [Steroidobacteraceae bacterium]|jgi:hypothetical protein|nr:hypothetical protein [Steroidobacteraceae bacterium]